MKRLIRTLMAAGLLAMLLMMFGGGTASADPLAGEPGSSVDACGNTRVNQDPTQYGAPSYSPTDKAADSNLLAINRWGSVADNFHTRLDAAPLSDLVPALQRNVLTNTMIQTGNSMWQGSTAVTSFATRFCLMDTLGYTADHLSAQFGNAVLDGGLVTFMVVSGVIVLLWRAKSSGASPWKGIGRMAGILSIMGVMVAAATHTTQSADGQHTSFAMGSPGFVGSTINNVIASLSSLPSSFVSNDGSQLEQDGLKGNDTNLSCANATKALRNAYKDQYGPGMSQLAASIPLTMSQMWENTGLSSWVQAQFGSDNNYGPLVYCHELEDELNTPRHNGNAAVVDGVTAQLQTQLGLLLSTSASVPDGLNGDSVAWDFQVNGKTLDQSMVGWAACRWDGSSWKVDSAWAGVVSGGKAGGGNDISTDGGGKISSDDCQQWWTTNPDKIDLADVNMNYEDNPGYIRSATSQPSAAPVGNFLLNWHGNDNGTAFTLAAVYLIAAFVMMIIFGGISLGIIIAKVAMIVLIALVFLALVFSLWPGTGGSRLTSYAKFYLGTALFTFGISVVFSLITLVTGFLAEAGVGQFGPGSLMSTLWTGFSPIAAVVVLNMIFKHGLKMPSPLKPGAALAYGAAIGGIGVAAGMGVESMFNRAKNRGRNGIRSNNRAMKNMMRRNQQMAPANNGSQTMVPKNDPVPAGAGAPAAAASTAAAAVTAPQAAPGAAAPTAAAPTVPGTEPSPVSASEPAIPTDASTTQPAIPTDASTTQPAIAPEMSAVAQRAADVKQQRLADKHHKTGGIALKKGRTAAWHRRTNTKLMVWSDRASSPARSMARIAAAGAAMVGVAGARGAAGMIDNAQQRVVRRVRTGWKNADLYNRGKDRAKLAMATMRAKPLRTAAVVGLGAVAIANPAMWIGIGAVAARKGYNRARPKVNGQRRSALATRRQNAPLRRSQRDQSRLDAWYAHQNAPAALPNTAPIDRSSARADGSDRVEGNTGVDRIGYASPEEAPPATTRAPEPTAADRDYRDDAGLAPVFGSDGTREVLGADGTVLAHARQDFERERAWMDASGGPKASDREVERSLRKAPDGRGMAPRTIPVRAGGAPTRSAAAVPPVSPPKPGAPKAPLPHTTPSAPKAPPKTTVIANQAPIQRRPPARRMPARATPTAAARTARAGNAPQPAQRPVAATTVVRPATQPGRTTPKLQPLAPPARTAPAPAAAPRIGAGRPVATVTTPLPPTNPHTEGTSRD